LANGVVTVPKLSTGTDGELITWDASGNPTTVPVGTAADVLTSNGPGAAPTFQTPAGGGAWSFVESNTFSTSALTITESLVSGDMYRIILRGNQSADSTPRIRINNDTGNNYGYTARQLERDVSTNSESIYGGDTGGGTNEFQLTDPAGSNWNGSATHTNARWLIELLIYADNTTTSRTYLHWTSSFSDAAVDTLVNTVGSGCFDNGLMTSLQLQSATGATLAGRYWVYQATNT
jgi:hypothetical protein